MTIQQPFLQGVLGPDPTDVRDRMLASLAPVLPSQDILTTLDFRANRAPVGKQNYGSCTVWGTGHQKEYLDGRQYGKPISLSKKFPYHNMKLLSGIWFTQGDFVRNAFRSLVKFGAPLLEDYPDTPEKNWSEYVHKVPSADIYQKALKYRLGSYWSVGRTLLDYLSAQQQYLAPVVSGMPWYESYNKPEPDGRLPLPSGKLLDGHCYASAGWTPGKAWFENSYGDNWGKNGYFYVPFSDFSSYQIWDAWIGLDYVPPKPGEGWVADAYLRTVGFIEGQTVGTTDRLNLREKPLGSVIETLPKGQKLTILDEQVNAGSYHWVKVQIASD